MLYNIYLNSFALDVYMFSLIEQITNYEMIVFSDIFRELDYIMVILMNYFWMILSNIQLYILNGIYDLM